MSEFDNTEEYGIDATKDIVKRFGWIFREITKRDVGLDAFAETPEGYLIYFQIKTGSSHFHKTEDGLTFYFEKRHFVYWSNFQAPVFIIAHLPDSDKTYYVKFDTRIVNRTPKNYKIHIPYSNQLTKDSKLSILDSIIKLNETGLNISFDNELAEFSFVSETVDLGRIMQIGYEKDDKIVTTNEKIIEISNQLEKKAKNYSDIIDLKRKIYNGTYSIKDRLKLLRCYLNLKDFNSAKTEIYLLISELKTKVDYENRLILNYCRLINYLISSVEDKSFDIEKLKEVFYMKLELNGENIQYYPDLVVVPILRIKGEERELKPILNNGIIRLGMEVIQNKVDLKIKIHEMPNKLKDKPLYLQGGKTIPKQGFEYEDVIYDQFSLKLTEK